MRILLVNTSERAGGAAIACQRLMAALQKEGVEVRILNAPRWRGLFCKALERLLLLPFMGFSWKRSWEIDVNWLGTDITSSDDFQWADVVHLHWVNQGMLSLGQIRKIARSGKKVVWTMHDAWNSTAVCHLTLSCERYAEKCQHCPLTNGFLAENTWRRKRALYESSDIAFTACSNWLRGQALKSGLLNDQKVYAIPNPIDISVFHHHDRGEARKILGIDDDNRKLILFVAQRLDNPYKGGTYLVEAMKVVAQKNPDVGMIIMGNNGNEMAALLPEIKTYDLGYQTDAKRISLIYSAADVFVLPSLSENLPNTIMEAMACGVPSVGFNVGGIPEMIDHRKNGYVAELRNSDDLAEGILFCIDEQRKDMLAETCVAKAEGTYSEHAVAERFKELYKQK